MPKVRTHGRHHIEVSHDDDKLVHLETKDDDFCLTDYGLTPTSARLLARLLLAHASQLQPEDTQEEN